jgi:hypothetical protein
MKRFGGIEFLSHLNSKNADLLDETVINQLRNLFIEVSQSVLMIDLEKIAALFQIHPPQVSVFRFFSYHLSENK